MLRIGIAGLGFMGMIHFLSYDKLKNVKVKAICTRDDKRRAGDWRKIQGNFGPPGQIVDLSEIAAYSSFSDLIASEDIDLVDITLPTALHLESCIAALEAGKHVFCEKPLALKSTDCERITAAAKANNRLVLVGHVLPFIPEYSWIREIATCGKYGKLLGGTFKRIIADPNWISNYWESETIGGPMLDLHVHDAHFIRLLFGMPRAVSCCGRKRNGLAEYWHTQFDYGADGPTVLATAGTISQQGRPFNQGFEIHLEHATLVGEFAVVGREGMHLCQPMIFKHDSSIEKPLFPSADPVDAFVAELAAVVSSIESGHVDQSLDAALAQDAIRICEMENESLGIST